MDWIMENYVEIFAVIGAAYSLTLMIVNLTPTPKDNYALEKVGVVLKVLAKLFGLDLTQGINTKGIEGPPRKKGRRYYDGVMSLMIFIILVGPGCATLETIHFDPRAECVAAQEAFAAIVRGLTEIKAQGVFDEAEVEKITILIHEGRDILDKWYADIIEGKPVSPDNWGRVQSIMKELTVYEKGK